MTVKDLHQAMHAAAGMPGRSRESGAQAGDGLDAPGLIEALEVEEQER